MLVVCSFWLGLMESIVVMWLLVLVVVLKECDLVFGFVV